MSNKKRDDETKYVCERALESCRSVQGSGSAQAEYLSERSR